jgi:3-hydroxybutyryl-CoA dehydrogenase
LSEGNGKALGERLAVVGGGAIACGVASTAAVHGEVVVWVRSEESASRARRTVDKGCEKLGADSSDRVAITTALDDLADATFVIEAIAEDLAAKTALLERIGGLVGDETVVATTTSALPLEELAAASGRPEGFVGLHVFNPVVKMKLVELAFPSQAIPKTRERAHALCRALDKTAVEVPAVPGFVVNRLLFPYLFDAVRMMDETGLSAEDIDTCITLGTGQPMGPLALLDFVGLDVAVAIGEAIGVEVPERLRDLVAEGMLGRKTESGIYEALPAARQAS